MRRENKLERCLRSAAALHRVSQRDVTDFLSAAGADGDPTRIVALAFDHFCREGGALVPNVKNLCFVVHAMELVFGSYQRTEMSLRDLKKVLNGGGVDEIQKWVEANV